ncbi:MAG: flagellar basal body L-ring protein FlgH [Pseudomonadota bacterium]
MTRALISVSAVALLAACASSTLEPEVFSTTPRPQAEEFEPASTSASLWNRDPQSLFGNRRAREVGDLLTVVVQIDDSADIINDSQLNRISERTFDMPAGFGLPQWAANSLPFDANLNPGLDLTSEERIRGQGNLRRADEITLRLAARIIDELPSGDLVIEGNQSVLVGADRRQLHVSGIVRPEDISRQNMVLHDRIAEADIRYVTGGPISATGRRGYGNRLLDVVLPF